jgi:hypothetical protein
MLVRKHMRTNMEEDPTTTMDSPRRTSLRRATPIKRKPPVNEPIEWTSPQTTK